MSRDEIIDVLDEDGKVIATISREKAERDNHITENVLIFLFDSSGKVWTQLRPKSKKHFPGLWEISACGGVMSGEKPAQAALRETLEETILNVKLQYGETFLNVFPGDDGSEHKRLSHLYIGFTDEIPQPNEEVDDFALWEPTKLEADILKQPNKYVPSFMVEFSKALETYEKLTAKEAKRKDA